MSGAGAGADPATTYVDNASTFSAPAGDLVTRSQYDGAGHVVFATDPNGNVTQNIYDGASRVARKILPSVSVFANGTTSTVQPTLTTVYDAASNPILATDANGNQTQSQFDSRNRAIRTILDLNGDGVFDPTQGSSATDIAAATGYDLNGNKIYTVDPNGHRTDTTYDTDNRPTQIQAPAVADAEHGGALTRPTTSTTYDKDGNVTTVTDPRGIVTQTQYDELNRPRFVVQNATAAAGAADRLTTESRYDANGNKLALVLYNVAGGVTKPQVTTSTYDPFNREISQTLPDIGDHQTRTSTTTYDRAGEAISGTDPLGQQTRSVYDLHGRVAQQTFLTAAMQTDEIRDSTYDANGNLLSRTDKNGTSSWTYDALNRQLTETRGTTTGGISDSSTVTSSYDADGNRTLVVYPSTGRVLQSVYDRANRLTQLRDQPAAPRPTSVTSFTYDPVGNRLSETLPNGVVQSSTFDAENRVLGLSSQTAAATPIYSITYAYDLAGQRRSAVEKLTGQAERDDAWNYDGLYRLTGESWTGPAAQTRTYVYDAAGNRLSETTDATASGGTTSTTVNTFDNLNEALSSTTGVSVLTLYTYDLNGNRITRTNPDDTVTTYIYDTSNRLIESDAAGLQVFSAAYDAASNRLAETNIGADRSPQITLYRYDNGTSFQELSYQDQVQSELIRAGGMGGGIGAILYTDKSMAVTPGAVETFTYDAVGNTVALTDATGTPTQSTLYGAFGDIVLQTGTSANNRLHNTKERDASTGLDYYGMRYYDSATGTFVTRDPSGYGDGLNVYQSVHDDPINLVDPQGLAAPALAHKGQNWQPLLNKIDRIAEATKAVAVPALMAGAEVAKAGFDITHGAEGEANLDLSEAADEAQVALDELEADAGSLTSSASSSTAPATATPPSAPTANPTAAATGDAPSGGGAAPEAVSTPANAPASPGGASVATVGDVRADAERDMRDLDIEELSHHDQAFYADPSTDGETTGAYKLEFESGKGYAGKGPPERAIDSATEKMSEYGDELSSIEYTPASNEREAFKQESKYLKDLGGARSDRNYNKVDSPGTKYSQEDDEGD